jgi:DNA-binding response OmpR family regulator
VQSIGSAGFRAEAARTGRVFEVMDNQPSETTLAGAARILIAEDEVLIAVTLEDYVRELGYEPIGPYYDLATALPAARTAKIDAAIVDIKFGEVVSYELAEVLTARNIPFGFATGLISTGLEPRWSNRPFLPKPYELQDLQRLLVTLLSHKPAG